MRYITEVSAKQIIAIEQLIRDGQYDTVKQFIDAAIQNQLLIHELPLGALEESSSPVESAQHYVPGVRPSGHIVNLMTRPSTVLHSRESVSLTPKTIWGLYNRIFPSKVGLRVLARLAEEGGNPFVDLRRAQEEAGKQARFIGKMLSDNDESAGRSLGEKLSTGLPTGKQDKALSRYGEMFIGSLRSDGKAVGLPADLGLVVIRKEGKGHEMIALTEIGTELVKLENPILDRQGETLPDSTLSDDEADFYLSHIRRWLSPEWERYQRVLAGISKGDNEPDKLDRILRLKEKNLKAESVSTERSGIISRLTELGLVRRRRNGLRVTYSLTERGEQYLNTKEDIQASAPAHTSGVADSNIESNAIFAGKAGSW